MFLREIFFFFIFVLGNPSCSNDVIDNGVVVPKLPDLNLLKPESPEVRHGSRKPWPTGIENKLCNLKIFVYNIPLTNELAKSHGECAHIMHMYGSEYVLWKQLIDEGGEINKQYVTKLPEEAKIFFIPFLGSCFWMSCGKKCQVDEKYIEPLMKWVKTEHPYWNRSNGRDHVMIHPMDCSYGYYKKSSIDLFKSAIYLTAFGDKRINASYYRPYRDIIIPSTTRMIHRHNINLSHYLNDEGNPTSGVRDIFALFVGCCDNAGINDSYSQGIRHLLFKYYRKMKGYVIEQHIEHSEYANCLSRAKYGLTPAGLQLWTTRLIEYIHYGVVPVIIADGIILPFEYDVDWDSMIVRIPRNRAHEIDRILKSISECDYEFKRLNVLKYGKSVLLDNDAWHYIVRDLCRLTDTN